MSSPLSSWSMLLNSWEFSYNGCSVTPLTSLDWSNFKTSSLPLRVFSMVSTLPFAVAYFHCHLTGMELESKSTVLHWEHLWVCLCSFLMTNGIQLKITPNMNKIPKPIHYSLLPHVTSQLVCTCLLHFWQAMLSRSSFVNFIIVKSSYLWLVLLI